MIAWAIIMAALVVVAVVLSHRDGYLMGLEHGYNEGVRHGQPQQQSSQDRRLDTDTRR
jgi:hypothetical protein